MKCNHCGRESNKGSLIWGQGFACEGECGDALHAKRQQEHDALFAEPVGEMPEALTTADFERWSLKFAIHWLRGLSDNDRDKLGRNNPIFLVPEQLALEFKDRILNHLHPAYVSSVQHRGHDTLFAGGTYCLRKPVPAETIIEACRKAELINV